MERTFHRRELGGLLLATALLLCVVPLWSAGRVNAWSLAFARPALEDGLAVPEVPTPPAEHQRGAVWMGQQALERGDVEGARAMLSSQYFATAFGPRLLGYIYYHNKNVSQAAEIWQQIDDEQSLLAAAEASYQAGLLDNARLLYRVAYALNPPAHTEIYARFLRWHYGDREASVAVLRASLNNYPNVATRRTWLRLLGDTLRELQEWDSAEDAYLQLLDTGDKVPAYIGLGWIAYERDNNSNKATEWFSNAIAQSPYDGRGYYAMGSLLEKERQHEQALKWYDSALERDANHRWWYIEKGNINRKLGNLDEALQTYKEATERFPGWSRPFYEMSRTYQLFGEQAKAREAIDKALELQAPPVTDYYRRAAEIYQWIGLTPEAQVFSDRISDIDSTKLTPSPFSKPQP